MTATPTGPTGDPPQESDADVGADGGDDGGDDDLALFQEFAATRSRRLRNQLVERHMGLAAHIAQRFARGGDDDVRQVAMIGLVKAVDRFDPEHGAAFGSFAGRTIEGEIKRYFRDKSWSVRVPRSAKELHLLVRRASDELGHELGRAPGVDEIAAHLDIERDDVLRGLAAGAAYRMGSLDSPTTTDGDRGGDRRRALSAHDPGFDRSIDREVVADLLARLPEREQEIVRLRFYEEMSQSEIAEIVGVSQMHVSRLLRRSFEEMRAHLGDM
jgi:RNA polymerase sigma-B factor